MKKINKTIVGLVLASAVVLGSVAVASPAHAGINKCASGSKGGCIKPNN